MSQIDQATTIRPGEELDQESLSSYLGEKLPGMGKITHIKQFPGGYSNLTYLIETQERKYVLRRPPFGANIKSAHDMSREFRVLSLLKPIYPKVPAPVLYVEDEAVIGAPFYLMERVEGLILRPMKPPKPLPDAETMKKVSEATIDNLVALHALDIEKNGLINLGKPQGYVERQVNGWIKRYAKSKTDEIADMDFLSEWMPSEMPPDTEHPVFIHNDYKYDNLVLNPERPWEIKAVLDWEMATVGHPLMDLGTSLSYWIEAKDPPAMRMFNLTSLPGNLSRLEVLERYTEKSGIDTSGILFHFVFASYKLAVIVQQIYARYKKGLTRDPRFAALIEVVKSCSEQGRKAVQAGRINNLY